MILISQAQEISTQRNGKVMHKKHIEIAIANLAAVCGQTTPRSSVVTRISAGRGYEILLGHIWSVQLLQYHCPIDHEARSK